MGTERNPAKMHNTDSRFVIILFAGRYVFTFYPGNFTGWGSERVNLVFDSSEEGSFSPVVPVLAVG